MNKIDIKRTLETPKKVTLDELIKRAADKKERQEKQTKLLEVKSLEGCITIEKPDRETCLDALNMEDENKSDEFLVFNCVIDPCLKSKELQKAYGIKIPTDIVNEIFEPGEVAAISKECLEMAGYLNSIKVVEDIKK